jgi:DNA-binding response OmpR family regulator
VVLLSLYVDEQRLILVVEDDETTRRFLADNLAADGFYVAAATGVGGGLWAIEVRRPALVLVDLMLSRAAADSSCSSAGRRPTASAHASTPRCP